MSKIRGVRDQHGNPILTLTIGTRSPDPREMEVHSNESYHVGWAYLGDPKNKNRRRLLRIRSKEGICSYRLWTEPNRGGEYMFIKHFNKSVQITKEQADKHFKITDT